MNAGLRPFPPIPGRNGGGKASTRMRRRRCHGDRTAPPTPSLPTPPPPSGRSALIGREGSAGGAKDGAPRARPLRHAPFSPTTPPFPLRHALLPHHHAPSPHNHAPRLHRHAPFLHDHAPLPLVASAPSRHFAAEGRPPFCGVRHRLPPTATAAISERYRGPCPRRHRPAEGKKEEEDVLPLTAAFFYPPFPVMAAFRGGKGVPGL